MIQSLQTEYKGIKFRSRLEARWAVFFYETESAWEYESEGYLLDNGLCYLPDFYIRNVQFGPKSYEDIYVEVKGEMTPLDSMKIRSFAGMKDLSDIEKDVLESFDDEDIDEAFLTPIKPVVVLGNIPIGDSIYDIAASCNSQHWSSKYRAEFFSFGMLPKWDANYTAIPCITKSGHFGLTDEYSLFDDWVDTYRTLKAYSSALSARFEKQTIRRAI